MTFGSDDNLSTDADLTAATYTTGNAANTSEVTTYGGLAVGAAVASTDVTTNQTVSAGTGSSFVALGNVNFTPGEDDLGNTTNLEGDAIAEGYVRGFIAVPTASASSDIKSNATLDVASGDSIGSGENTTIGAYPGTPSANADGSAQGYEIGFIPVSKHDSSPSTSTTSAVTIDGTVAAGIYHTLDITIPNSKNSGKIFSSTINTTSGGAPYVSQFIPDFNPQSFIGSLLSGNEASVLESGSSTTPVGAFLLGPLFASGGTVTVNAGKLSGSGSITAYGSPTITVTNASPDYLVLGATESAPGQFQLTTNAAVIPDIPGGTVLFTGQVGLGHTGSVTVHQNGAGGTPAITVNCDYDAGSVGSVPYGPALFVTGEINNLGGSISLTDLLGSYGEVAGIYGDQVDTFAPNGVAVIAPPPPEPYISGSDPSSDWQNVMTWPGGNPDQGVPNPNVAIAYVANAQFNASGQYATAEALTAALIGSAGQTPNLEDQENYDYVPGAGDSYEYLGGVIPWVSGSVDEGTEQSADALSPAGQAYAISGSSADDNEGYFPVIPVKQLTETANSYSSADLTGDSASTEVYGSDVDIQAQTLDIDSEVSAGQPTNWSVTLNSSLAAVLQVYELEYAAGLTGPIFTFKPTLPAELQNADPDFKVTFDARTQELTLDNITASSDGESVYLDGAIINTAGVSSGQSPLGQIHVNNGLGHVTVTNQTGYALVIQNISTGDSTLAANAVSTVDIIDTNQPKSSDQTLYVYQNGQGISVYTGSAGATLGTGTPTSTVAGNSTTYNLKSGLRWQWTMTASLSRTATSIEPGQLSISNWVWDFPTGSPNDPWQFVAPNGSLSTGTVGEVIDEQGLPVFDESITSNFATPSNGQGWLNAGNGTVFVAGAYVNGQEGFAPSGQTSPEGPVDPWLYYFPLKESLTLTSSVKADNPIGIDFSGSTSGSVDITSDAPVILKGTISNPQGNTTISASGGVTAHRHASIVTENLTLTTTGPPSGGIGTAQQPLEATLESGGILSAQASSAGIYLTLTSGAIVSQVTSGDEKDGYGDVDITADGSLTAQRLNASSANITGDNITITNSSGSVGSANKPLILSANSTQQANGGTSGGVVNISAPGDIGIEQTAGDLLVGTISSTAGDVYVDVPSGAILDASGETPAQALSPAQSAKIWKDLRLTAADGAAANAQATVTAFQNLIDAEYQEYWQLLDYGTVTNGIYTLNPSNVSIYQAQAAAALGLTTTPTNQQVEAYATALYKNVVSFFVTNLGASWNDLSEFQTYDGSFQYSATAAQVTALTKNSVWTTAELSYTVDQIALENSAGAPVGIGTANIVGHNITLDASGGIGTLALPVLILLSDLQAGTLTKQQATALALATTPGDVLLEGTNGHGKTVTFPFGEQPAGVTTVTGISVQQTAPLFISATGSLSTTDGGAAYLQSTAAILTLSQVQAGGNVDVVAPQEIVGSGAATPQIETPGNLTLLAGSGAIGGGPSSPLVFQIGGELLSAAAGTSVSIAQSSSIAQPSGNLIFGSMFAGTTATVSAVGSISSGGATDGIITAGSVALTALGGTIGASTSPVTVDQTASGSVTLEAKDGITLAGESTTGAFDLASAVSTTGNVTIDITIDGIVETSADLGQVTAQSGNVSITAVGSIVNDNSTGSDNIESANITLDATAGSIGSSTLPLVIGSPRPGVLSATAATGIWINETNTGITTEKAKSAPGAVLIVGPPPPGGGGNAEASAAGLVGAPEDVARDTGSSLELASLGQASSSPSGGAPG